MRILITGGAGFIGSHTADRLLSLGHRIRILDNLQPAVHPLGKPDYLDERIDFLQGDVRNRDILLHALNDIDVVYHFAAYQDYLPDFSTFFSVNTVSTALLYELIVEQRLPIQKIIVAASQAVMGEGRYHCPKCAPNADRFLYPTIRLETQLSQGKWDHECPACGSSLQWLPSDETVIHPCNPYAISKHAEEAIAVHLGARYGIPSVVMRYSIVQGPRQSIFNAYSGAMRIFALSLYNRRPPCIFEDGNQVRDFVNIEDVVDANVLVLEKDDADGKVFNVGGNTPWTINAFYNTMQAITGIEIEPIRDGHYRYGDTRHIVSDTKRLQSLGWAPKRTVPFSIERYWEELLRKEGHRTILESAEADMKRLNVIRKARHSP